MSVLFYLVLTIVFFSVDCDDCVVTVGNANCVVTVGDEEAVVSVGNKVTTVSIGNENNERK